MKPLGIMDQIGLWTLQILIIFAISPGSRAMPALALCLLTIAVLSAAGVGLSMWVYRGRLTMQQDAKRMVFLSHMPVWLVPLGGGLIFIIWKLLDALTYRELEMLGRFYTGLIAR